MKHNALVGELARAKTVEHLVEDICCRPASQLGDLVQMVYEALLRMPSRRLRSVIRNKAIVPYIAGMIKNQYFSASSAYHRMVRKPERHASICEIE